MILPELLWKTLNFQTPKVHLEEKNREEVADNLVLVERGQYNCQKCNSIIGEYRVFEKKDDSGEIGKAKPNGSP